MGPQEPTGIKPSVFHTHGKLLYVVVGLVIGMSVMGLAWWQNSGAPVIAPVVTSTPTKTNYPPETLIQPKIDSVSAHRSALNPRVWAVDIRGAFPSFCYQIQPVVSSKDKNIYNITINALTKSEPCPEVRQDFFKTVDLDAGPVMAPGEYGIHVNNVFQTTLSVPEPLSTSFVEDDSECVIPPACDVIGKCTVGGMSYYQKLPSGMSFCPTGSQDGSGIKISDYSIVPEREGGSILISGTVTVPDCITLGNPYMTWQSKAVNLSVDTKYDEAACNGNPGGNVLSLSYTFTSKGLPSSGTYSIRYNGFTNKLGEFVAP